MNWIDYIAIGILAASTIISFFRGFAKEAISICIWIAGIILAFRYAPELSQHLQKLIHLEMAAYIVSFILIFAVVWLFGLLINMLLHSAIQKIGLGSTDKMLGSAFGLLRGLIIVTIALMFIEVTPFKNSQIIETSKLVPYLRVAAKKLDHFIPDALRHVSQNVTKENK